jgi:hypothetical protein
VTSGAGAPAPRAGSAGRWAIVAVAAGLAVVVACGLVGCVVVTRVGGDQATVLSTSDEAKIRKLVNQFAAAVDREDQAAIVALLCTEEAEGITDDEDYDPSRDGGVTERRTAPITISDIRITGDVASARISRPSQPDTTLYFRKENGVWKVCAAAGDTPRPSPSPSG